MATQSPSATSREMDADVSDPNDAEKEADAVGDQVADHLHGGKDGKAGSKAGGAGTDLGEAHASEIFRAWIDKAALPGTQKAPTTDSSMHLVELGITDLGPYRYFPMQGTFESSCRRRRRVERRARCHRAHAGEAAEAAGRRHARQQTGSSPRRSKIPGMSAILAVGGNVQRHCISGASDMKSNDDVALRAAFGMIGGSVQGVYTSTITWRRARVPAT